MSEPLFDLTNTALERGATLIEASAGTGKTYTIAGLFLRLLLEENLSVREILVVTYTDAATEELRDRIRQTLAKAAKAFTSGEGATPLQQALLGRLQSERPEMIARLERALRSFDEAPIFTIHGFCQRTLKDRAFESGALFDTELMTDQSALLRELADDFWRRHFYPAGPVRAGFAIKSGFGPEKFLPLLNSCISHPHLKLLSPVAGRPVESLAAALEKAFTDAGAEWRARKNEIKSLFGAAQKKVWANKPYNDDEEVAGFFADLELCFSPAPTPDALARLETFSTRAIADGTGKNKQPPPHRFFELCDTVLDCERDFLIGLQLDFFHFAKAELPRRKNQLKVQSYDDLLTRLHGALAGTGGDELATGLRAKYRAALIDEFQDTDPVQYQIFRGVFSAATHWLFLIGDPKQAIYGFRGADIFTYLEAAQRVERRFTLGENWRSESGLVAAVNTIFRRATQPFVFDGIQFHPVEARGAANKTPLTIRGLHEPPLQIWFCPRDADGKPIPKGAAEAQLPQSVAAEIARLLNGDARLGERRLRPEDVAVLVMTHRQAQLMQAALNALGIPSVQQTQASLFASDEAREVSRLLAAIAQPGHERWLKAALATPLIGLNGAQLDGLAENESVWQTWLEKFHRYFDLWSGESFIRMFRLFLHENEVRPRLLAWPDGERRLTNVLHLAEVLHQAVTEKRLGLGGLLQWLAAQIESGEKAAEEHQLRLERDENAVKLVTVHKSKGLEYPVVFCPFSWNHSDLRQHTSQEEHVFFHERDGEKLFARDFGTPDLDRHRGWAREERLAENVRLLYVALTRAKHRCYFVWGGFKQAESAALAWLLHAPPPAEVNRVNVLEAHVANLDDRALLEDLRQLADASADGAGNKTIRVTELPSEPGEIYRPPAGEKQELVARRFTAAIPRDWRVSSFSSLAAGRHDEAPDYDATARETAVVRVEERAVTGIFAFPRGAKPGTCLHEIFEKIDFTEQDEAGLAGVVAERLRAHRLDAEAFGPVVTETIQKTLAVPLAAGRPDFKLSRIANAERLTELEFYFPLNRITPALLREVFIHSGAAPEYSAKLERLGFQPTTGFLKGFVDLVFRFEGRFYIVDWKSNWLGPRVEDYGSSAMQMEMVNQLYVLQYHLYTVALHQYLALRLPGYRYAEHFGGVRYIFVRGVDVPRPELGVFHDRPSEDLVEKLSELLVAREEVAG